MEVKINQRREQFLKLSLENTESSSKILTVQALIDTGCNVDLSISSKLAKKLGLEVAPINAVSKYANGKVE
ncbi:MAG: aspartyl protease family protein [Rivularia sp. (in: cyanobacteria)]